MELGRTRSASILAIMGRRSLSLAERLGPTGRERPHGYSWRHVPIHETYAAALKQFNYADIVCHSRAKARMVQRHQGA